LIGEHVGDYTIKSELGSGGMGTVYLADAPGAKRVAVKVFHPHLLDTPGFFERILREADLGRKVDHANVVRTLDADALAVQGKPVRFMVMEYVEGKNLRELLDDLGTVPETLLREIAVQAAAGLTAIHDAGIVHRDLKPENIVITDAHEVRIMDLGVAKLQEASVALTKEGRFAGSLPYAAPEQFRKDEVGPRADLYSLGVLLYELATGQNPFRSDDIPSVIQAHLAEQPPRAHERNPDLSLFFAEVVATLLAKQPADRFASAQALRTTLVEGERSAWWAEHGPDLEMREARLPKIRVARDTRLYGREDEMQVLHDAWTRARNGAGNTVFLEGEEGIGKTRLVDAFLRAEGGEGAHVLYGAYPPSRGLGGLSEAVLAKFGEARLGDKLAPYLTVTPGLVPAFAALIKHESPPAGAEPVSGGALHAIVVHLMRALAAEKPTVWVVDDLQFASQESRDLLLAMARAVEDHRVLLVAASRPGPALEEYGRLENFRRVPLGRLGGREIIQLLEEAFRSERLAERLGGKITKKSDGVPFFIFEMIRTLKEARLIEQLPDGSYAQKELIEEIEVPSAVKDLIEARMRALTEEQRAILDVAAVQGTRFEPALVAHVLEEKKVRVLRQVAEIERRFGLVRGEAAACAFDQNQIQEVLYGGLLPELRNEYHTLLAEAHAERVGDRLNGNDAVFLAHHHLHGSRPPEALPFLDPALDHLAAGFRNEALLGLARRALQVEGLLEGERRARVLLRLAGCLDLAGRRAEQRAALDEALALADGTGDPALRADVRQRLGVLFAHTAQGDAAQAMLREALELARVAGDRQAEAQATGGLGKVLHGLGRYAEAREHHERSAALAREAGDRLGEARAAGQLGNVFHNLGRYAEAREHHERSRALCLEIGNRVGEAQATGNLGNIFHRLGHHAEAQEHYERVRTLSREVGHRLGEAIATDNLGGVLHYLGRYAEAQELHERARALSREIGDRVGEAVAAASLGQVLLDLGSYAEAKVQLETALALCRETGYRRGKGSALLQLAVCAEADGEPGEAERLCGEALALGRELGEKVGVAKGLVCLGCLEVARGDTQSAATHLDEALNLARETKSPDATLAATVERARLPDGDAADAEAALAEYEERVGAGDRMMARFRLWELTRERAHLEEAHRLLRFARDHAPENLRDSMVERVPLHRDILKAWAEAGA
jgi:tetratricopeptide (TPR) repeat protein/predicted Ser/Thr protein kinase